MCNAVISDENTQALQGNRRKKKEKKTTQSPSASKNRTLSVKQGSAGQAYCSKRPKAYYVSPLIKRPSYHYQPTPVVELMPN